MINFLKRFSLFMVMSMVLSMAMADYGLAASQNVSLATPVANRQLQVFRSPSCGCCSLWVDHMREAGFQIKDDVTEEMPAIKQRYGVSPVMESCHTAIVDGYVVEGHVPAADVQRLLAERPDVIGIAAPGMPIGSPGMEQDDHTEPYTVLSFDGQGEATVFSAHYP